MSSCVISLCKAGNKNGSHLSQGPEGALSSTLGKLVQELGEGDDTGDILCLSEIATGRAGFRL